MSKKTLLARQNNNPSVTDLKDIMQTKAESEVSIDLIEVVQGFNPRYNYLSDEVRDGELSEAALEPLIKSITEKLEDGKPRGILQPLVLRPKGSKYLLIAGERRYWAAKHAGLSKVPAVIRNLTEKEALEAAIIENAQRQELDMVSEALNGFELMATKTGLSIEDVVNHLSSVRQGFDQDKYGLDDYLKEIFGTGISTWSQSRAKILKLTHKERLAIQEKKLSSALVFPLIKLKNSEKRGELLEQILAMPTLPAAAEVEAMVRACLQVQPKVADLSQDFKSLIPQIKKLHGPKKKEAEEILEKLKALLVD